MALTHLRIALIQEPENVDYRIFEAELSLRLGDVGGAQKILDTVDLTRVTNPRLLEGAAVIRIRSGDKAHAANAVRILTGMVGQYPNDHLLVYQRARGYLVMDKKSEAKRDLEKYVASAPETSPQMADAKKLLDELKGKRPWWKF
jgi:predicted Zn-dependent protease